MCGLAGFTVAPGLSADERMQRFGERLRRMTASLFHRGPDAQRALLLDGVALGHTRLSIVDLRCGHQPMVDPGTGITVIFNGEIFNHVELREELAGAYAFRTRSDTEVILAAFLRDGSECVRRFIGQFALVIWDPRERTLWLARDRVGICPLYYFRGHDVLAFASEAKALFAGQWLAPQLDACALKETLQLWVPVGPRTSFVSVRSLPPGMIASYCAGQLRLRRYWDLDLGAAARDPDMSQERALQQVGELLADAIRLRLRADVPVATYLSGGLDSSLVCALAQKQLGGSLQTFSVAFEHAEYDERRFQSAVAGMLHTEHHCITVGDHEIGELLPAVVEHAEQVLLRSAPAPLLRLASLAHSRGTRVVLTGEGADELFWGYDIYKETAIRQFWARQSRSSTRPRLLTRLYPYLGRSRQSCDLLREFYGVGLDQPDAPDFSHRIRWSSSGRIARFLSPEFARAVEDHDPVCALLASLPDAFTTWRPLARAQYLEMRTLLSGYLLSCQADRMLMAHSVEGRFPFLDHRLIELAARLPERMKLRGLEEKSILKHLAAVHLPASITHRHKFPYRAPIAEAIAGPAAPAWARELLTREMVDATGVFDGEKVARLRAKLAAGAGTPSEADSMALVAVATTQLLVSRLSREPAIAPARLQGVSLATSAQERA